MEILITQLVSATFVMNEDGEFHCNHEDTVTSYEAGGDGMTEPRGGWAVECLAVDCDGIRDDEVQGLLERFTPHEPDYDD